MSENSLQFAAHLSDIGSYACVAHGIAMGSNLGLFEVLAGLDKPATCEEVAKVAGYRERYVREWLALMVTGKIIDYDVIAKTYYISEYKKPLLTVAGKGRCASIFMPGVDIATNASTAVEACFKPDGPLGVPYSRYEGLHKWRDDIIKTKFDWSVIKDELRAQTPELFDALERGVQVCDAGCSTGQHLLSIARHYPKSQFTGYDIDDDAIQTATSNMQQHGLNNVTCVVQDGCNMPDDWSNRFDVMFVWDVVHDLPYSAKFLREIIRVLKPGGIFFMMDINMHTELADNLSIRPAALFYGISFFHCMPVSLYHEGGEGLGAAWGVEKQRQYLEDAGFKDIKQVYIKERPLSSYFVSRKQKD